MDRDDEVDFAAVHADEETIPSRLDGRDRLHLMKHPRRAHNICTAYFLYAFLAVVVRAFFDARDLMARADGQSFC